MTTLYGADMSHYDAAPVGLGTRLVAEGFSFVTHKAGGDANDQEIDEWWDAVKDVPDPYYDEATGEYLGLFKGCYWVLRPDLQSSPSASADSFLARLDSTAPGWRERPFILQADCEEWKQQAATKPGKAYIKTFCDRLRAKAPKLMPIVYASAGQYGTELNGLGYPLWNARYVLSYQTGTASDLYARCGGDGGKGWAAYSGQVPAVWQFTSSATIVGQTTCDANVYRGTLADMIDLLAPGWEISVASVTPEDVWGADLITNPKQRGDSPLHNPPGTNTKTAASFAIGDMWARIEDIYDTVNATAKVANAAQAGVAALQSGGATITQAQLDLAVLNALKTLAGGQA